MLASCPFQSRILRSRGSCPGLTPTIPQFKDASFLRDLCRKDFAISSTERDKSLETRDNRIAIESSSLRELTQQRMNSVYEETRAKVQAYTTSAFAESTSELRKRIGASIKTMQKDLVERDTEVRLLLLTALSGEHILFIGPPGTAKSELGRRLSKLCAGSFFERLLTKFSVPEELFGPLSMRALEDDKYIRQTEGYLPEATVAFIDEIFKANSAILNTLLTILNERLFDNGSDRYEIPLLCLVGASNELPESEELDALYDRFLVRKKVQQVSAAGLVDLLAEKEDSVGEDVSEIEESGLVENDFLETRIKAKDVKVPLEVIHLVTDLRTWLQQKCEPPVYVSDRRLVKAIDLMKVSAYCNGREEISEYDALLLQHIFWNSPEESERIYEWLLKQLAADQNTEQIHYLLSSLFGRACRMLDNPAKLDELVEQMEALESVLKEKLFNILLVSDGDSPYLMDHVWLSRESAEAVMLALQSRLEKSKEEVERTLFEVVALKVALEKRVDAVLLATLMPRRWSDFIRHGPQQEVHNLGVIARGRKK